jgi:hypothetical protein
MKPLFSLDTLFVKEMIPVEILTCRRPGVFREREREREREKERERERT